MRQALLGQQPWDTWLLPPGTKSCEPAAGRALCLHTEKEKLFPLLGPAQVSASCAAHPGACRGEGWARGPAHCRSPHRVLSAPICSFLLATGSTVTLCSQSWAAVPPSLLQEVGGGRRAPGVMAQPKIPTAPGSPSSSSLAGGAAACGALPGARVEAATGGSEGDSGCRLRDTYLEPFVRSAARRSAQPRVCISVRICSQAAPGERGRAGLRFLAHKPAAAALLSHTAARGERHGEAGVAPGWDHGAAAPAPPAAPRLASPPGQGSCRPLAPCAKIKKGKNAPLRASGFV